jgi:hypothetical protein
MDQQACVTAMLRLSKSKRRMWQSDEDKALTELVRVHGAKDWSEIAKVFRETTGVERNGKQCRERWCDHLHPDLLTEQLTQEEKTALQELYPKYGTQWTQYRKNLPRRSCIFFKNYVNGLKRRRRTQLKRRVADGDNGPDAPRLVSNE